MPQALFVSQPKEELSAVSQQQESLTVLAES
jgi:hypothetical protein